MTLPKSESQTCFQGIPCGGQNTIVISIASVVSLVISGDIRDFKTTVESLMRRVYMYVLISTAFSHCYARLDENGGLGVFYLAGKVDLASKVGDVVLLKTKAFNKRLTCLFYCRTTRNKRVIVKFNFFIYIYLVIKLVVVVVGKIRELSGIFSPCHSDYSDSKSSRVVVNLPTPSGDPKFSVQLRNLRWPFGNLRRSEHYIFNFYAKGG